MFFLERWNMPPTVTLEQPLAFLRWAPGVAAAWDKVREREQERRAARHQQPPPSGPKYGGH